MTLPELRWRLADDDGGQSALFEQEVERHIGRGEYRGLEFLHVHARRVVNEVPKASRMPFRWTINAYRGCSHACSYCFARPTHEYLGMNAGEDFDRRIVVKVNAVERVRAELAPNRWAGDHIAMGTNTDPYQRCEGKYRLTQGIVAELAAAANPFSILTKSTLILRDLNLLSDAARRTEVGANFSIGTLDTDVWRMSEPGTPHPLRRIEAVARLNEAGVPSGVLLAPVLPGISDAPEQLEAVVKACVEAGARFISPLLLHLRAGVREHYLAWLAGARPDLIERYRRLYPRAYAPTQTQNELGATVRTLVERHGGRSAHPTRTRSATTPSARPSVAGAAQLDLGL
ncbi:MAG: radical SAM protein [Actinomycetota bacterium]|nr:radical SAM protein [Actinomycetota bacterium]